MKSSHPFLALVAVISLALTGCPAKIEVQGPTTYVEQRSEVIDEPATPPDAIPAQAAAAEPATEPAKEPTEQPTTPPAESKNTDAKNPSAESTDAKKPADINPGARPKADRTPRKPGEAIKITFDNIILGMQADIPYRPWMLNEDVQELEGKKVSITGVMYDTKTLKKVDNFVLLRNSECKYGKGGQADHLADIRLKKGHVFGMTKETVRIEGVLRVEPQTGDDGNTWRIYVLEDATAAVQ